MSPRSGAGTRERILDAAESRILLNGYAATSIDEIIEKVGITKGAFFYHFKSKSHLARALIDRFAAADNKLLRESAARAETLASDPLQKLLVFVGLFIEMAETLEEPSPGCLFASYCYESGQFDSQIHGVAENAVREWRSILSGFIREAMEKHVPRAAVDVESLADMLTVVFEGAFIMARLLKDPKLFAAQLRLYRQHLELLFAQA